MNETSKQLTAVSEAQRILDEARKDSGFDKMLKFRKGVYICDGDEIPLGTEYVAHPIGWVKMWVKFVLGTPTERRVFRVVAGEIPPERPYLPDLDQTLWEHDPAGRAIDPWSYQYLLPMEPVKGDGAMVVFVTSSWGGRRAVSDLCAAWSRKRVKDPDCGLPVVKLDKAMMPSKKWGDVVRPDLVIVGWDSRFAGDAVRPDSLVRGTAGKAAEPTYDDDIPF